MSSVWERVRRGVPLADCDIIDMHGHIGRCTVPTADQSLETHIAAMDRMGVRAALISHVACLSWDVARGNEAVLEAMRAYPGRFLGYVGLWPCDAGTVRRETETRLAQGFTGIKLHRNNGFPYTDPAYAPAFALAHARALPVLLHTWGNDGSLDEARQLTARYPDAALLLAHAGVLDEDKFIAIARECPGVYLDPTISRTPRGLWERLVDAVGPERLVWGTDASFYSMTPHIGKVAAARISDEAKRLILGGNARRLLERAQCACA